MVLSKKLCYDEIYLQFLKTVLFSKCEIVARNAYLDSGQNCFIVRFFIPLLLANIPMKPLETYTISSELI
jgi:hypothetical protein